uniref:Uncharacterized protein n=1 Tax=Helicotheca tamesis TaxID=374047 RepID=A0A7S2MKH4_9STRA|mmetsp:Transcript_1748/g.2535  ORF Transcript_1748/g.2535 Transcript_1748/m.2535 type:complete len:104 (+) Transcript_1748:3-314(+)
MDSNFLGDGKPGLAHVLTQIEEKTGDTLKSKCNMELSLTSTKKNSSSSSSSLTENEIDSFIALAPIDNFEPGKVQGPDYYYWMNKHVDWEAEGYIGYTADKST